MNSTSCTKDPGARSPAQTAASPSGNSPTCIHVGTTGRRCHMAARRDSDFCKHHGRLLNRDSAATADELLASVRDFSRAADVNLFLGNLLRLMARRRIERRDAIAMAYLCQLILNSQSAILREEDRMQHAEPPQVNIVWDLPAPLAQPLAGAVEKERVQDPGRGI